jgi:hypothetical protein
VCRPVHGVLASPLVSSSVPFGVRAEARPTDRPLSCARPGSSSFDVSPPQSCFVVPPARRLSARGLTCRGFVPIRDVTGAVHFSRGCHSLAAFRPQVFSTSRRFAPTLARGLVPSRCHVRGFPFRDATRSLAGSSPVAAPLPLASVRSPIPVSTGGLRRLRGFDLRAVCVSGLALPFPLARPSGFVLLQVLPFRP